MRKPAGFAFAKTKAQISFAVKTKLTSAFVFGTRIVQFLFFLNPKFAASSHLLCLHSLICVRPVRKPHCLFSHDAAHFIIRFLSSCILFILLKITRNKIETTSGVRLIQRIVYLLSKADVFLY